MFSTFLCIEKIYSISLPGASFSSYNKYTKTITPHIENDFNALTWGRAKEHDRRIVYAGADLERGRMERQIDINSINKRALKLIQELSN